MAGLVVIISSPSGGGKDAVIRALIKKFPKSARLITTTTRSIRPKEKAGKDYYFITPEEFKAKIAADDFIEHNFYSGNYYGSEKSKLENLRQKYQLIFTNIDVHGKINFDKAKIRNYSIFLLPENTENLKNRIAKRGGTSAHDLELRLKTAKNEIKMAKKYDALVVNKEGYLKETVNQAAALIRQALTKKAK